LKLLALSAATAIGAYVVSDEAHAMEPETVPEVEFLRTAKLPTQGTPEYEIFQKALASKNPKEALQHWDKLIQMNPDNVVYYYRRGHCHFQNNELRPAIADLDQVIKMAPNDPYPRIATFHPLAVLTSLKIF
jgi:tetratricopeptide (TPR) repeat protein